MVLNGQYSSWASITAGVPQDSDLVPLFFLIYINDLSQNLSSKPKLLADDTTLFSVVDNLSISTNNLNKDLKKVNDWATQWKMSFNPSPTKQAQDVNVSRKIKKPRHTPLNFNSTNVKQSVIRKHLGLILDNQVSFEEHLKTIFNNKVNKTTGLIRKLLTKKIRYQDYLYWLSTNVLFNLVLTMEILFTISRSVILFKTKLKVSNIMHILASLLQ